MSGGKSNFESITSAPGVGPNSAAPAKKGWLPGPMFWVGVVVLALIGVDLVDVPPGEPRPGEHPASTGPTSTAP